MAIGIILGAILFAITVTLFVVCGIKFVNEETTFGVLSLIGGIVALLIFVLVPFSIHVVDTGEVAVVKYMGEAKDVRTSGTHYDFWVTTE